MKPAETGFQESANGQDAGPLVEGGLIVTGLVAQFFLLYHGIWGDGTHRFNEISQLLETGTLSTDKYSLVGPLFSVPLWLLGKVVETPSWWLARYNVVVFALGLLTMYGILRNRVDRGLLRKFLLLLVVASMFPFHLQAYYGEVFTAVFVGVGIVAVVFGPTLVGWGAVALGVANTPATLVGLAGVALKRTLGTRRLRSLLPIVVAAGLIGGEAWIRRGSPFKTRYESGFTNPFFFGVISLLFSFGMGVVFYAPGLLLPVKSRIMALRGGVKQELYQAYLLWMLFLVGLVLVYANWYDWSGAWFWGPRFLLFASIPASFALAVGLHHRGSTLFANLMTLLVLCLSCWVGLDGAIFGQGASDACTTNYYAQIYLCFYSPEYSALWRPFVVLAQLKGNWHAFLSVEQVGVRRGLYALYSLAVFVYLAAPLVRTLVRQAAMKARELGRSNLRLAIWRL